MVDGNGGGGGEGLAQGQDQGQQGTSRGLGLPAVPVVETDTFLQRFRIVEKIGEGSYSDVIKCKNRESGILVACKRLKRLYRSWNQVNDISEVTTLRTLERHPHILQMLEIHYDVRLGKVSLVFEMMDMNLYELIKDRKKLLPENTVRLYMFQLCKALRHIHKYGIFHRDIKPENILVRSKSNVLKLADLGSVRGIYSQPPFTEYISTRWYRSPECLLTAGQYGFKMDIWAAGCVFYEILTLQPLFPGSSEIDQITRIHNVMGAPPHRTLQKFSRYAENDKALCRTRNQQNRWDAMLKVILEFTKNPKYEEGKSKNYDFTTPPKEKEKFGLDRKLPSHISSGARDLVKQMLTYDPDGRPSSQRIMAHAYFNEARDFKIPESEVIKAPIVAVCGDEYGRTMISYYYGHVDLKTLGDKKPSRRVNLKFSPVNQQQESSSVSRTSSPLLRGALSPETPERVKNLVVKKPTNPTALRSSQDSKHKLKSTPSHHESPPNKSLKTEKSQAAERVAGTGNQGGRNAQDLKNNNVKQDLPDFIRKSLVSDAFAARKDRLNAVRSKDKKIGPKTIIPNTASATAMKAAVRLGINPDWLDRSNNNTNKAIQTPYLDSALKLKHEIVNSDKTSGTAKISQKDKLNHILSLKSKEQNPAVADSKVKTLNTISKIPSRLTKPSAPEATISVSDKTSSNNYSGTGTTTSKPPLPPKYTGATAYRSELLENKPPSIPKGTKKIEDLASSKGKVKKQDSVLALLTPYFDTSLKPKIVTNTKTTSDTLNPLNPDKQNPLSLLRVKEQNATTSAAINSYMKNQSKISKIPSRLPALLAGATTSDRANSNNSGSITTIKPPPLPPKYFGATVYRSELPENNISISKESKIAQILENAAANHRNQPNNTGTIASGSSSLQRSMFGVVNDPEADKQRTERMRAQLREEVYCSSDDDIVSSMRHKLDILISDRARRASELSNTASKDVEEDVGNSENRAHSLRPRRLPKKDVIPIPLNNDTEVKVTPPAFQLVAPRARNILTLSSVGGINRGQQQQYANRAAAYFETRQREMQEQALLDELPQRTNNQN